MIKRIDAERGHRRDPRWGDYYDRRLWPRRRQPTFLIDALIDRGARDLTIINNNAGNGEVGLAARCSRRAGCAK
ncbi:hypothetical protein LNO89_02940 [Klebsiella pneumoniae subsp. pneumoniae]|nr:hypothetical protein [Klebsiella pneumoniae subsp. pneumoniae]